MEICGLPCPPLDEEALLMPMMFDLTHFFDDIDDGNRIKMEKQNLCGHGIGKQMERLHGIGKQMERLKQVLNPTQGQHGIGKQLERLKKPNQCQHGIGKQLERLKQVLNPTEGQHGIGKQLERLKKPNQCHHGIGKQLERLKQPNQCQHERSIKLLKKGPSSPGKFSSSSLDLKLESVRRKVHQAYEEVGNAKKRKAIRVIDFQPIPELEMCPKKPRCGVSSKRLANKLQKGKLDDYRLSLYAYSPLCHESYYVNFY
jgi:hypothetical protein